MNKNGFYLIFFAIFSIVILSVLLVSIMKANTSHDDDIIGLDAVYISKIFDEGERIKLYLDYSVKFSKNKAADILMVNAGYTVESTCKKIEDYVLLSPDCGQYDPSRNFEKVFSNELNNYKKAYISVYSDVDIQRIYEQRFKDKIFGDLFRSSRIISDTIAPERSFIAVYSEKQVSDSFFIIGSNIISFSDIKLMIESSANSAYTITPKYKFEDADLEIYEKLYQVLAEGCVANSVDNCAKTVEKDIGAITYIDGNVIKMDIRGLKVAFDISSTLPQKLTLNKRTIT